MVGREPMRNIVILFSTLLFAGSGANAACPDYLNNEMRILGTTDVVNFCEAYGEKPLLIVNTASNCGYTHQFSGLEKLHQLYRDRGLVVLGFSSDDFFQEEDNEEDAAEVCLSLIHI